MSEYEAIFLFREYVSDGNALIFDYISVLSAFLIMSYLLASKLKRNLAIILLALYSITSFYFIFNIYLLSMDGNTLLRYILNEHSEGTFSIPFFIDTPPWIAVFMTFLSVSLCIGGYFGALLFFYYQRKYTKNVIE